MFMMIYVHYRSQTSEYLDHDSDDVWGPEGYTVDLCPSDSTREAATVS
jgi:hypothetical protein